MWARLLFGLGLFSGSLLLGRWLGAQGVLPESRATRIIQFVLKRVTPLVLCLAFWRLEVAEIKLLLLPCVGAVIICAAALPAWAYARAAGLTRPQTGSFVTCAMFSNLGFLGAFIAFALFGEAAFGLANLYMISFSPCFYLVGFGIAKRFGRSPQLGASMDMASAEGLRIFPILGLLLGLGLSLAHVPRPEVCESINRVLIPLDTAVFLMAIGSQLRIDSPGRWLRPALTMSAIKCWYNPLVAWALVSLCHLEGLPRFVVLLQASMPVGVSTLMLPVLFGVDRRLTNNLWFVTTLLAVPWLLCYLPMIISVVSP